jgi:hypothetical protein
VHDGGVASSAAVARLERPSKFIASVSQDVDAARTNLEDLSGFRVPADCRPQDATVVARSSECSKLVPGTQRRFQGCRPRSTQSTCRTQPRTVPPGILVTVLGGVTDH